MSGSCWLGWERCRPHMWVEGFWDLRALRQSQCPAFNTDLAETVQKVTVVMHGLAGGDFRDSTEAPLARLKLFDRGREIGGVEFGPHSPGKDQLCIGALP
jgi:hypothetical protein